MGTAQITGNTRITSPGIRVGPAIPLAPAQWNPLDKHANIILSNNNLTATNNTVSNTRYGVKTTNSVSTGKYYWEITLDVGITSIGIAKNDWPVATSSSIEADATQITYYSFNGALFVVGGPVLDSWSSIIYSPLDVISVALDASAGKIWFGINGTWQNVTNQTDPTNGISPAATFVPGDWFAAALLQEFSSAAEITANFGNSAFSGTVPSGYTSGFGI